jgi:hypothetical protein
MNNMTNRNWMEHEKYQLWIAYNQGASFKIMELFFRRSGGSINKYLSRSGIREKCKSHKRNEDSLIKINTLEKLEHLIIACGLDHETVGIEREVTRYWHPSDFAIQKLKEFGIGGPCPWSARVRIDSLPQKSGIGRASIRRPWVFSSMNSARHYIMRNGHRVTPIVRKNAFQWTYVLDGKPVTDAVLLTFANHLRMKHGEPIFLVEGVTYDG